MDWMHMDSIFQPCLIAVCLNLWPPLVYFFLPILFLLDPRFFCSDFSLKEGRQQQIATSPAPTNKSPSQPKPKTIIPYAARFKKQQQQQKTGIQTDNLPVVLLLLWPKSINFSSPRLWSTLVSWPLSACSWPHVLLLFALCSNKIVCVY